MKITKEYDIKTNTPYYAAALRSPSGRLMLVEGNTRLEALRACAALKYRNDHLDK